jgi:hypothetical protein
MALHNPDLEKGDVTYVCGYPSLAAFLSSDPDHSAVIYRRFDFLSARNLLYLQSELAEFEAQLRAFDQEDLRKAEEDEINDSARSWKVLQERARDVNSNEKKRIDLAIQIREKLKEYRKSSCIVLISRSTWLSFL